MCKQNTPKATLHHTTQTPQEPHYTTPHRTPPQEPHHTEHPKSHATPHHPFLHSGRAHECLHRLSVLAPYSLMLVARSARAISRQATRLAEKAVVFKIILLLSHVHPPSHTRTHTQTHSRVTRAVVLHSLSVHKPLDGGVALDTVLFGKGRLLGGFHLVRACVCI